MADAIKEEIRPISYSPHAIDPWEQEKKEMEARKMTTGHFNEFETAILKECKTFRKLYRNKPLDANRIREQIRLGVGTLQYPEWMEPLHPALPTVG